MELCTSRHLLLSIFILQLIIVSCRQLFDFLGYMWTSVLANFIYTLFIIFGIFGLVQSKSKYTIAYIVSSFYWIFWNLFIMCIYFNVLGLNKLKTNLSFRTNSSSWWETSGPGCRFVLSNFTLAEEDPYEPLSPDFVVGCIIDFRYVEGIQAAFHAVFGMCGLMIGIKVSHGFISKTKFNESKKKIKRSTPLYSIEYSARKPEELYYGDGNYGTDDFAAIVAADNNNNNNNNDEDSDGADDDNDDDGDVLDNNHNREDDRSIANGNRPMTPRRVKRKNINSKYSSPHTYQPEQHQQLSSFNRKTTLLRNSRLSGTSSTRRQRISTLRDPVSKFFDHQRHHSVHEGMLNDSSTSNDSCKILFTSSRPQMSGSKLLTNHKMGHVNPNFVSSTSLDRPPSARSSYSNYHGVRTLAHCKQATPQVPSNTYEINSRPTYSTFFNDGPPAYEMHGVTNSETII